MKTYGFVLILFILLDSVAYGQSSEEKTFAKTLKEDSGPLCSNFKLFKTQATFCLEDPNTKILYQFEYNIEPQIKTLILSAYNVGKKEFTKKMNSEIRTDGVMRTATMSDPQLYTKTWPLNANNSDEAYFLAMITLDLKYNSSRPDDHTPIGNFLLNLYHHLGMTPVAEQKLLPKDLSPDKK